MKRLAVTIQAGEMNHGTKNYRRKFRSNMNPSMSDMIMMNRTGPDRTDYYPHRTPASKRIIFSRSRPTERGANETAMKRERSGSLGGREGNGRRTKKTGRDKKKGRVLFLAAILE